MLYAFAFCLLLAVLLTVLALRRPDGRRRLLRVAAGVGAAAGLGLAAFPPTSTRVLPATDTAILLTDAYSPDTLRQLQQRLGAAVPVWRYAAATIVDTPTVRHAAAIRPLLPGLRQLHVLGQGLPAADVAALAGVQIRPHADGRPAGFQQAAWPTEPQLGQTWAVSGRFEAAGAGPVWVSLHAAGAARDSVQLPAGRGTFRLRFAPKAEGRAVYTLEARRQGRRIAQEPVPVLVQPTRPLRLLLLAAAPSFEFRFLKTELAARQHAVALRTGVSRGLTQTEFLNLPNPPSLDRLTPAMLARFDVVLTDAPALAALSASEQQALARATRNGTNGLVLLADGSTVPRQLPGGDAFRLLARPSAAASLAQPVQWPDGPAQATALLPVVLQARATLQPLIFGPQQQPVAAARRLGLGQVVVTTVPETFPWLLQNQAAVYDAYWSRLLTAAAPPRPGAAAIQALTRWPYPNAPLLLRTTGSTDLLSLQAGSAASVPVALRQDAHVPEWAAGTYWPAQPGWHEARLGTGRQWLYVYAPDQWRGPAYQEWQQSLSQLTSQVAPTAETATQTQHTAWPRWWGYLLFLVCAGLLWLEEKL
ncbi:hypothetical protein [Hymenobacter perfusus]|uniref:Uncharacterized protein n=1 Tax=Hymenobacter perfusus TaxID=1236770 RepID=A0A428K8C6_9BACT|nr:hypothetical protein [Hymenobacter perfusus]RSK42725.1 hypothetical protein EI293_13065 [Hymenobacter perfusus]